MSGAPSHVRALVRRHVPAAHRQLVAVVRRRLRDMASGTRFGADVGGLDWPAYASIDQTVTPGPLQANKLTNLRLACSALDGRLLHPDGRWSFWHLVGRPSAARGYTEGRTIKDGRLVRDVGGGLCQLSSLLYHLALVGGLEVIERHAHTLDIYRDEERYMPLGSDATVVWGFKDLRLRNPYVSQVAMSCSVDADRVRASLHDASGLLRPRGVAFASVDSNDSTVTVTTVIDGNAAIVTDYERRPGMTLE